VPLPPSAIETALGRPRASLAVVLIVIPVICWVWVAAMARDMYGPMTGASAWMMTVTWDAPRLVLLWAMGAALMAGMMLPSAAPGGVMNLIVILALTAWVAIEKLAPFGRQSARVGAALLLALGGWMALR
jgi:predicted metal-binding membrane protein